MKHISRLIIIALGLALLSPIIALAQSQTYQKPTRDDQAPNGGTMITLSPQMGIGIVPSPGFADTNQFALYRNLVQVYDTTTTIRRIYNGESGIAFVTTTASANDVTSFTLPPAKVGLRFTFYDRNTTSGGNLAVKAQSGDFIDTAAAPVMLSSSTITSTSLCLVGVSTTQWHVDNEQGTWVTPEQ